MNWKDELNEFKAQLMKNYLSRCDDRQQAFFHKIFPNGVSDDKYNSDMELIERTILKNIKGRPNV